MWLRASQFVSLQPIIPAQVIVKVTSLFFFLAKAPISNPLQIKQTFNSCFASDAKSHSLFHYLFFPIDVLI